MRDHQVMNSQAGQRIEEWLSQHTLDELNQLNEVAKNIFSMTVLHLPCMEMSKALSGLFRLM